MKNSTYTNVSNVAATTRKIKGLFAVIDNKGKRDGRYAVTFSGFNAEGLAALEELRLLAVDLAFEFGLDAQIGPMGTVDSLMGEIARLRDKHEAAVA